MHCPLPLRQTEVPWEPSTRRHFVANSRILQREVNVRLTGEKLAETDDLRRESVPVVADGVADHRPTLPAVAST
jgi:hypothetical protein